MPTWPRAGSFACRAHPARQPIRGCSPQGVFGFEPTLRDQLARLALLRMPGRATLRPRLSDESLRRAGRLNLAKRQLAAVEAACDAALAAERVVDVAPAGDGHSASLPHAEGPDARLLRSKGSDVGLPSLWKSGGVDNELGIFTAGNARVRKAMGQLGCSKRSRLLMNTVTSRTAASIDTPMNEQNGMVQVICSINGRSEQIEKNTCSNRARSSSSGVIEFRPLPE